MYTKDADGVKTYITLERSMGDDGKEHDNLGLSKDEKSAFRFDETLKTLVRDVASDRTCYMGTFNTLNTIRASSISYATESTNFVGGLATLVNREDVTDAEKLAYEVAAIDVKDKFKGADSFRLPTKGSRFTDVTIEWAVEGNELVTLNARKDRLTIAEYTEKGTATLTATIKAGEVSETVTIPLTLTLPLTTAEEIVNAAYALASGEKLDEAYTLTGVITSIKDAYSSQYSNVSVVIQVGDMTEKLITCYRMKGTGADVIKVGDTITCTGILTNYNGTIEFEAGCTLDSYVEGEGGNQGGSTTDPSDSIPAGEIVSTPVAGVEYYLYAPNSNGNFYFNGTEANGRINGATDKAVKVILEETATAGEFYLYFMNNDVKTYINGCTLSSTDDNGNPKADTSDFALETAQPDNVWVLDVEKKAFYTKDSNRMIATDASKDFTNFSTYAMSNYGKGTYAAAWFSTGTVGESGGDNEGEVTPPATESTAVVPEAGKAYIFGMTQANVNNTICYLAGGMSGYYMATTTDASAAIATYIEATEGGYYFYTLNADGSKLYINMVVSGTHVNGAYEASASTVYTIDETNKTLIAVVNDEDYWFGTRNDNTYTTMGPCKVSYAGFFGQFYGEGTGNEGGEVTPPTNPDDGEGEVTPPTTSSVIKVDTPYIFGMTQANVNNTIYYLAGGMSGYYMATTTDATAAIKTYIEATEGGYYFYTLNADGSKLYINMVVSGTHVNGAYEASASTVYTIDETNKTLIAVVNDEDYWFGTRNDNTYTTMGPCKVSYAGFFGVFYGESDDNEGGEVTPPTTPDDGEGEEEGDDTPVATTNKVDFNTIVTSNANGDSSYTKTFTTESGWTVTNSAIQAGGSTDINPQFKVVGPDNTYKAVCLNGKVGAAGKLTSSTLTGGISSISMKYTKMFTDTILSVTITITDKTTGETYTKVLEKEEDKNTKYVVYDFEWTLETPITGDFTIEVVNNCPSNNSSSNKDRITILELSWAN